MNEESGEFTFGFTDESGVNWVYIGNILVQGAVSSDDGESVVNAAMQTLQRLVDESGLQVGDQLWLFRKIRPEQLIRE